MPIMAWSASYSSPSVISVAQSTNGIYTNGQYIQFNVVLDQVVNVTLGAETPYIPITIDTGINAKAIYTSGSGSNVLIFRYTIENTHSDYSGIVLGTTIVNTNSTIQNSSNENLVLTLNGRLSTTGLKVDGIIPKVISNSPIGNFPTTKRDIEFIVKFNKSVKGVAQTSFELVTSPSITASIIGFKKMSDSVYHVWVTDATTTASYTGTIKLNILSTVASAIQDSVNQSIEASSIGIGTAAEIQFPLVISVSNFGPTPTVTVGGTVDFVGTNFARVDKVLIGNVEGKIIYNNDITMRVLVMPGSDTTNATLKIVRGVDTLFPIAGREVYKAVQTNLPITQVNLIKEISFTNPNRYASFAMEKHGNFAIICDPLDINTTGGACALFINDNTRYLDQKVGWRQVGQKFNYPFSSINNVAFGSAVTISANQNRIAITAKNASDGKGEVLIYNFNKNKNFSSAPIDSIITLEKVIVGLSSDLEFGTSIELSADGNMMLVSAPGFSSNNGAVYAYKRSLSEWESYPVINMPVDALGSNVNFGSTIALSADGEKAFITGKNDNGGKGAVWGFQRDTNIWNRIGTKITASNYTTSYFGSSIALSANANKIIIGAYNEDNAKGAVYYFKRSNDLITQVGNAIKDTTSDLTSQFGTALSMSASGDIFAVSAPQNNKGAFFVYGTENDAIELLYSKINKSTDSSFGKNILIDYEGYNLLHEITYTNGNQKIAGLEASPKPVYRSLNRNLISRATTDTIIAKMYNAKSVSKVVFADSIILKFNALTDTTIAVLIDSSIQQTKNTLDFRYGIQNNISDSIYIDRSRPTVKVIFNKNVPFNDNTFQAKLRFSKKVSTNIITQFPLLPNGVNGLPAARLDSVKEDTAGLVYTAYYRPMISGPIFLFNQNQGSFYDTLGNAALAVPNTDTIVYDSISIKPLLYINRNSKDSIKVSFSLPETKSIGSIKLTFSNFLNDSLITTWVLSDSYTNTGEFVVNLNDNPLSYAFVNGVLPNNEALKNGKYLIRISYRDYLMNPPSISDSWTVNFRDSLPTIYTYTPVFNNKENNLEIKGRYFNNIDSIRIGNKSLIFDLLSDTTLVIRNKTGAGNGSINFYFDSDSTSPDFNLIKGGINALAELETNKVWQKISNKKKGKLINIQVKLRNSSSSIDHKLLLELYKDTVLTTSLDPAVKFTGLPLSTSDTITLTKNSLLGVKTFTFSDSALILDDSTDYYFTVKQLDHVADANFKILTEQNNSKSGAVNNTNTELFYQLATKPFVFVDTLAPKVMVIFNKNAPFNDTTFQAKLRFNERVTTNIVTNFPLLPNGVNGNPTARLDSVKVDTAGFVYTAYFKALISGPIFLYNSIFGAFLDTAGNRSLPILSTDTIRYDTITESPRLYVNRNSKDSFLIEYQLPETRALGTVKLTFSNFSNDTLITTWVLSNTFTRTGRFILNLSDNPISNTAIQGVLPSNAYMKNGKYTVRLSYRDSLLNPPSFSESWTVRFRDSVPNIYTYTPLLNTIDNDLQLKGINFTNIDNIKIGNKQIVFQILTDSTLIIRNKTDVGNGFIHFYYDLDSTVHDLNYIRSGINASTDLAINKVWQKFRNDKKGKLNEIAIKLSNNSTTTDNQLLLVLYKDTVITSSLDPAVKFIGTPFAISDTITLARNSSMSSRLFSFSDTTLILEDSTDYYFTVKQLDHIEDANFKVLTEASNERAGAVNNTNLNLFYQVATKPYILMDTILPNVQVFFNKTVPFNGTQFQAKLRFSKEITTDIVQYFPLLPNGVNLAPSASLDSVRVDTAGFVYTAFYKPLIGGPIFLYNSNFGAFNDSAGNRSLPIQSTDTIYFDNSTAIPSVYANSFTTDSIAIHYWMPENLAFETARLTFTDLNTGLVASNWILSNTITSISSGRVNVFDDPSTFRFVTSVFPAGSRLTYGKYRFTLSYQDYLSNPLATSPYFDFTILSNKTIVYDYSPAVTSAGMELLLKGLNFNYVDSIKINRTKVTFQTVSDSVLKILDKTGASSGYINFYFGGDSTVLDFNQIDGAINASVQFTVNKTWQKFYNQNRGKLKSVRLKLANTSTTIDNKLVLELYKDSLVTNSLNPSLKFNAIPLALSDTLSLLKNTNLSNATFNFDLSTLILNDSTNYFFVLKQIDHVAAPTTKILGESSTAKNAAINENGVELFYEIATKPYVFIDTVPPRANIVNTNLNRAVSGPFWVDLVFNEPVNDLTAIQTILIPSIKFGQPAARADSVKTILPNIWYRQYFTPLQLGTILLFNVFDGVTRDLAGNNSLPIGIDSVNYIGNNFKLRDYDFPYTVAGNTVTLKGDGFGFIDEVKLNNQVIADSVVNDSTILITIPNNAVSGPLVLKNIAGDSTNNKLVSILNTGTSNINPDTLNLKFIPIRTGAIDSIQLYFTNGSVSNTAYQLQVFDHNGDKKYTRMIASSDTVLLNQNIVQQKVNLNFPQKHFVVFKDSVYYIRFVKINHSNTSATILGGSNGVPRYNYAVNARILIANSPMSFTITNNSVNGVVGGNYYIDFLFNRPLRSASLPLMLTGLDSSNNILARVDSTVISNDGLRYRQFITPLKQGKILFFNANFGSAYDYYGYATPPFGFDTVTFKNVKKPFIKKYNFTPVSTGRVINLIGKNLTNVKKILIGNTQATHYVNNDDTLTFISPLNAGSGRIQIIDVNNDTIPNLVDTLYTTANTLKLAHQAWQEFVIPRTGLIHKVGINFQNTSTVNAKFQLKIYNKDQLPSSLLPSVKFDNAFLVSDTISVIAGQNNIKYFTFKKSDPIVALDSHFYFVIHQLDENQNIQIKTDLTIEQGHTLKGSAGGVAAKLYHTLEMESFLKIDTIKPIPVLKVQKQVVTGSFYVDLTYTKPVDQYDPNPIVVDAFNDLPKATLDSAKVLELGLKFRYFYKPVYKGQIKFIIPNQFAAIDFAGNGSDISNLASLYVVDTTIKNVARALGELSVCEGDSVQLFTAIDSALDFEWNTLSTQRLITTKSSGAFFIRIKIDSNIYYNSDTLNVTIRNNPIVPKLSRSGDLLVSSAKHNNKWYKNNTLLSDSINTVKPNASAIYTVRKIEDGCLSAPSTAYSFTFVNIDSLKSIVTTRPTNFCIGDSVVLSYVNNTFKQFRWSTGDTTKSIVVKKAGTYFVQFQLDSTYTFMSDSIQVKVFDIPAKPAISRTGDSIRSTSLFGNIWYKNTSQLLDTNNRIKPSQSDYYAVKVALNGCESVLSQPYYYIITDIGMLNNYSSSIHPNPFIDQVYIDNRFNSPGKLTLEVINISNGKKVISIELLNNMNKVNLPTLAGGLYLFNVINASGTILHQQKLIKL